MIGNGGIRTHAIEMTGALNQRLRPLGHATLGIHSLPNTYKPIQITLHRLRLMLGTSSLVI